MSRVAQNFESKVEDTALESNTIDREEVVLDTHEDEDDDHSAAMQSFTRRVTCTAEFTSAEVAEGVENAFTASASKIFSPVSECEKGTGLDFSKGIVTEISINSMSSDYPRPIHLSMNLFNGQLVDKDGSYSNPVQVKNVQGWLYTPAADDFGGTAAAGSRGFTNLLTIMPREQTRHTQVLYAPENVMSNRFIQQYGRYSPENLRHGIIPFSNENYVYVPDSHVVMNVIRNNWESLGINADLESKRENKYIKVDADVVNDVVEQLKTQVLSKMPFTNFKDLKLRYNSTTSPHVEDTDKFQVCAEFSIKYMFPNVNKID
jgi:hypothetical protein